MALFTFTFWKKKFEIHERHSAVHVIQRSIKADLLWLVFLGEPHFIRLIMNLVLVFFFFTFSAMLCLSTQTPHPRFGGLQKFGCMSYISGLVHWKILDLDQVFVSSIRFEATDACFLISILFTNILCYSF